MRLRPLRKLASDERASVSVITAASFVTLLGAAALAVDVGSVFLESRKLQGVADLAAISAARDLGRADAAASATVAANELGKPVSINVLLGGYAPDRKIAPADRFQPGSASPSAARVTLQSEADLYFGQILLGKPTMTIRRQATAARADLTSFSIGTRLGSLQGGVANELLSGLTGSTVSLSVMDYESLANANVDLLSYVEALRVRTAADAGSYDHVLKTDLTTGEALEVLSEVLQQDGELRASKALGKLAVAAGDGRPAKLNALLDLGPYGDQDHASGASRSRVEIGAMDMANALLVLAGEGRQVKLDVGAGVPGIADLDVWLAVGERPNNSPWLTVDRDGDVIVRTAQTRIYLKAKALGALGGLGLQPVNVPVLVEAASGEARLSSMECPETLSAQAATLAVRPSVGRLVIGEIDTAKLNNFKQALNVSPARLVDLGGVLKATAQSSVSIGGQTWQNARFTRADIEQGAIKTVSTHDVAQGTVSSLLRNTSLNVNLLGLGLNLGVITQALSGVLTAVAAPLDGVINTLTGLLGVRLGEADVRVNGLRCRDAALVA